MMFKNMTGFPAAIGSLWGDIMNTVMGMLSSHVGINVISDVYPFDFDSGYGVDGDAQINPLTGEYACKNNGVWTAYAARKGVVAYRITPAKLYANTGSAWVDASSGGGGAVDTLYTADGVISEARTVAYTNNLDFVANAAAPAAKPNFRVTQDYANGAYLDSFVIDASDNYGGLNFYRKSNTSTISNDTVGLESFVNIYDGQIGFNFGVRRELTIGSANIEFDTVHPTHGSKLHSTVTAVGGLLSELLLSAKNGVFLSANNGTISTDITIDQYGQLFITSTESAFAGIEYTLDYSPNFSTGSLINLGYADATYAKIADVTPTGSVTAFAGGVVPAGWLFCDGSDIDRTTYAALFAAIGTDYGVGDGSTTFNIPDLRGEFIRGFDAGRGVDTGRVLGSSQADELKAHTHSGTTIGTLGTGLIEEGQSDPNYSTGSIGSTGGTETRPRNIAMNYMIKA